LFNVEDNKLRSPMPVTCTQCLPTLAKLYSDQGFALSG
jgi:hypothetical protein